MSKDVRDVRRRALILAGVGLFIAAAVVLAFADCLIPSPLAELAAFSYIYISAGKVGVSVLFIVLTVIALSACVTSALSNGKLRFLSSVVAILFLVADAALHLYVFLASSGYNWNYLASAFLDAVLLVCVLYRSKESED